MAYSEKLAADVRDALSHLPNVTEKKMFRGLAFLVNDKMCINVSGNDLMVRFDPALEAEVKHKKGFRTVVMKGREYKGYGYISEEGYRAKKDFDYWVNLALAFNDRAQSSRAKKKKKA